MPDAETMEDLTPDAGADAADAAMGWSPPPPECALPGADPTWEAISFCRAQALLSVNGTAWYDVWMVGAGGRALRFDGCNITPIPTGTDADLWWVAPTAGAEVWAVGAEGTALRYSATAGAFETTVTDTTATLFGVWGPTTDGRTLAVGFDPKKPDSATIQVWHAEDGWASLPYPTEPPNAAPFKIDGQGDELWIVGRDDLVWHADGKTDQLQTMPTGAGDAGDWVTVALTDSGDPVLVGGTSAAIIAMRSAGKWTLIEPDGLPSLQGVCFGPGGKGFASGIGSTFLRYDGVTWTEDLDVPFDLFNPFDPPVPGCGTSTPDYHGCYIDPLGQIWATGGNFLTLTDGAIVHFGSTLPTPPD